MRKESFVLYLEQFENINNLSLEDCGLLLKGIINHVKGEPTDNLTLPVKLILPFITTQIDRDRLKYNEKCEQNTRNGVYGILGGRPRKQRPNYEDNQSLKTFLDEYTYIKNDLTIEDISDIDFQFIKSKIQESDFLKRVKSLKWLVGNYDKITTDYYVSFNKPTKPFANQREYSKEDFDALIDNLDDLKV